MLNLLAPTPAPTSFIQRARFLVNISGRYTDDSEALQISQQTDLPSYDETEELLFSG